MIKNEISELRKKIVNIVENDESADKVMRINMQLFPLSNPDSKKTKNLKSRGNNEK